MYKISRSGLKLHKFHSYILLWAGIVRQREAFFRVTQIESIARLPKTKSHLFVHGNMDFAPITSENIVLNIQGTCRRPSRM